ncbi:Protein YdgA [Achromobacter pulmonis]|uniref:Protein YdgA n=1 Tax=Achromobacter pulmonis TaxID=1389932 RepID=A0A6S7CAR3_9BURK|nr:YdgA family protein [Achromobacter pulmonis]CAB3840643.1 Protein YdgA [Achromobacter pulmonis]
MRKWVAAGVAVLALGAIWTGAAWVTGKRLESGMARLADSVNQQARQLGASLDESLSFEQVSYERGVFASQALYRLKAQPSPGDGAAAAGRDVEFVVRLAHGPFPWQRLSRGNLIPVMTAARAELVSTPAVEPWFAAARGAIPLTARAVAGYGRDITASLALAPLERVRGAARFNFSGLTLQAELAGGGKLVAVALRADHIDLAEPFTKAGADRMRRLALQDLSIAHEMTRADDGTAASQTRASLKQWTLDIDGKPVTLRDVAVTADASGADTAKRGALALRIAGVDLNGQRAASLRLDASANNLDLVSFRAFRESLEQPRDGGDLSAKMVGAGYLMKFLLGQPQVSVSSLRVETASGAATLQLDLGLTAPTLWNRSPAAVVKEAVRQLDIRLSMPVASLADLIAARLQAGGIAEDLARDAARQQADGLRDQVLRGPWGRLDDGRLVASLSYQGGDVDVNGERMPVERFLALLISRGVP